MSCGIVRPRRADCLSSTEDDPSESRWSMQWPFQQLWENLWPDEEDVEEEDEEDDLEHEGAFQEDEEDEAVNMVDSSDLKAWLAAAKTFTISNDFDITDRLKEVNDLAELDGRKLGLTKLMTVMKEQSAGKTTIMALGDKIVLSSMLWNLDVPQMPMLFSTRNEVRSQEVEQFVHALQRSTDKEAFDIVVKPTHLSDCLGARIFSRESFFFEGWNAQKLVDHMQKYLAERPAEHESEALKSLTPGFIIQPKYKSCVGFHAPLEMRVVTVFGKARMGIWWWGRKPEEEEQQTNHAHRTAWLVRKQRHSDQLSKDDDWEVAHEHVGKNRGFDAALGLFKQAMPAMAAAAEGVATAVGAPFLRVDFFVGSRRWGLRLNEVAYGSGTDYKRKGPKGTRGLIDDGPKIAYILQEGFKACKSCPPEDFLSKLGTQGDSYEDLTVSEVPQARRPRLPSFAVRSINEGCATGLPFPVPESECVTRKHSLENDSLLEGSSFMPGAPVHAAAGGLQPCFIAPPVASQPWHRYVPHASSCATLGGAYLMPHAQASHMNLLSL